MPEPTSNININELKSALSQNFIHYEINRIDYTINDSELSQLEEIGKDLWKEVFFATLGVALPCLINGIISQKKLLEKQPLNTEIFINYLVGGICFSMAIISLILWVKNSKKKDQIIYKIKNKPQFKLPN